MTRFVADSSTIPVSCGHRAMRDSLKFGERNRQGQYPQLYWCETCGEYRMSGGKTTGLRAFDFLLELRDEILSRRIVVDVDDSLPAHGVAVIEALGATVRFRGHHGHARRSVGCGVERTCGGDPAQRSR